MREIVRHSILLNDCGRVKNSWQPSTIFIVNVKIILLRNCIVEVIKIIFLMTSKDCESLEYFNRSAYLIPYIADAEDYKFSTIIVRHSYP